VPINRRNSCRWVIFIDQTTEPFKTNHRMSDYSPIDLLPRTKLMNMHVNSANRRCCYGILEFSSAACHAGQTAALRSVLTAADEGGGRPQWECSFSELYKFEATLDQNCVYKISYHFHFFKPHMKSLIILEPFLVVCNRGWLGRTSPPKKMMTSFVSSRTWETSTQLNLKRFVVFLSTRQTFCQSSRATARLLDQHLCDIIRQIKIKRKVCVFGDELYIYIILYKVGVRETTTG